MPPVASRGVAGLNKNEFALQVSPKTAKHDLFTLLGRVFEVISGYTRTVCLIDIPGSWIRNSTRFFEPFGFPFFGRPLASARQVRGHDGPQDLDPVRLWSRRRRPANVPRKRKSKHASAQRALMATHTHHTDHGRPSSSTTRDVTATARCARTRCCNRDAPPAPHAAPVS